MTERVSIHPDASVFGICFLSSV